MGSLTRCLFSAASASNAERRPTRVQAVPGGLMLTAFSQVSKRCSGYGPLPARATDR